LATLLLTIHPLKCFLRSLSYLNLQGIARVNAPRARSGASSERQGIDCEFHGGVKSGGVKHKAKATLVQTP